MTCLYHTLQLAQVSKVGADLVTRTVRSGKNCLDRGGGGVGYSKEQQFERE